jgi:hypothetical protein
MYRRLSSLRIFRHAEGEVVVQSAEVARASRP